MTQPESSSYLEVYEDAHGDAVIDVYLSPEDIRRARREKVTLQVDGDEADLVGVTAPPGEVPPRRS